MREGMPLIFGWKVDFAKHPSVHISSQKYFISYCFDTYLKQKKKNKDHCGRGTEKGEVVIFLKISICPMITCRSCSSSSLRVCKWWSDVRQEIDWNLMSNQLPQSLWIHKEYLW